MKFNEIDLYMSLNPMKCNITWNKVSFGTLEVAQLVKEFHTFYEHECSLRSPNNLPLDLASTSSVWPTDKHPIPLIFMLIISSHLNLYLSNILLLLLAFQTKYVCRFLFSVRVSIPTLFALDLITFW